MERIPNSNDRAGPPATYFVFPCVRRPDNGLQRETKLGREVYRRRQVAGGGILAGSTASQERNWNETAPTLFYF